MKLASSLPQREILKQLPITAISVTGAVVCATALRNYPEVAQLVVRGSDNWPQWAGHAVPSIFISPDIGRDVFDHSTLAGDIAIMGGQTLGTFWLNEKKEGIKRTLKIAGISQLAGSVAAHAIVGLGIVQNSELKMPDVGTSSMTVGLGANFLTVKSKESNSRIKKIGYMLGNVALGLSVTVGNYYLERSGATTDATAHLAGWLTGSFFGLRKPIDNTKLAYNSAAEADITLVENGGLAGS